ncbi:MAG: hypothetical protein CIT01_08625 [Methanobacterium sp. BRmetb2]|jgi:putative membrane protein|nr:MAG: hypothetical protein CIT01_08625 [Methanobacterium sp. BRmetb2]
MSSVKNVTGLSKYMVSLPRTKTSLFSIIFVSFLVGITASLIESSELSILYNVIYGGTAGFFIFGFSSIMTGGLTQYLVNSFKGRKMKMKQSMFLAFISMMIIAIIYLVGVVISEFTLYNYIIDALIFGFALAFAFRIIVIWATSNISLLKSIFLASFQPALIFSMLIVIAFLTSIATHIGLGYFSVLGVVIKIIIAALILMMAIYSFVMIIESPMRKNLGIGVLEFLSLFISHLSEGSSSMEKVFEDIGEPIDTLVGITSFKTNDGIKSLFLSPCVHPGPIGNIGGGNMPTILAQKFNFFTMVSHGPSTHDFNPVSTREIDKIEKVISKSLEDMDYSSTASEFLRIENNGAKIGAQYFNNNLMMLATLSPKGFDDIDFGVGLALMNLAKSSCGAEEAILIDCHNCFKGEKGRILPGNKEVFDLMEAVGKIDAPKQYNEIIMGCAGDNIENMSKEEGVGESGVKVMIIEVNHQKTAYILLDANNMVEGFRERIINHVKKLGLDYAEVMTTDTHFVNTLAGGHNPIGMKNQDKILDVISECVLESLKDLEKVEVAVKVAKIEDIKTLGPTNATELVTTISSIVAVSRIFAPFIFILALFFVFIWIFYWAF